MEAKQRGLSSQRHKSSLNLNMTGIDGTLPGQRHWGMAGGRIVRNALLASVAMLALASAPARAADQAMPVKAPPAPVVVNTWTGYYFGIDFGGGNYHSGSESFSQSADPALNPAGIVFDGDEGRLSEQAFLHDFAGDLPEAKAKALYAVQWPFHKALLAGKTTHAAWRSKPSWYAVSTEDRTINPDLERFMAKRMGAKTIEVKASHVSLISQPDIIAKLILEAAGQS